MNAADEVVRWLAKQRKFDELLKIERILSLWDGRDSTDPMNDCQVSEQSDHYMETLNNAVQEFPSLRAVFAVVANSAMKFGGSATWIRNFRVAAPNIISQVNISRKLQPAAKTTATTLLNGLLDLADLLSP